jgi:hypothetical protein
MTVTVPRQKSFDIPVHLPSDIIVPEKKEYSHPSGIASLRITEISPKHANDISHIRISSPSGSIS